MIPKYPLRSLQVFEAVSRHKSFAEAANELNITKSAISHQLRNLTTMVGEELLVVDRRSIALTSKGKELATSLRLAFSQIEQSFQNCVGESRRVVRLAVCSSVGFGWISSRMKDFTKENPDISLQLSMYASDPIKTETASDIFISANPFDDGFFSSNLIDEELICVINQPTDLDEIASANVPLISTSLNAHRFASDWHDFCREHGASFPQLDDGHIIQASHYLLALGIARHGGGIALVPSFLAQSDIGNSALVQVSGTHTLSYGRKYYVGYKYARADEGDIRRVSNWIIKNFKKS